MTLNYVLRSDPGIAWRTRNQPLGDPKAGVSAELDALTAYVASLTDVGRSPYRNPDGTMTDDALLGKAVFHAANCASCHLEPLFTDSPLDLRHDVGTMTAASGQRLGQPLDGIDTPTLLGLWEAPPYHHLGDAPALTYVLANAAHGTAGALTPGQKTRSFPICSSWTASRRMRISTAWTMTGS